MSETDEQRLGEAVTEFALDMTDAEYTVPDIIAAMKRWIEDMEADD